MAMENPYPSHRSGNVADRGGGRWSWSAELCMHARSAFLGPSVVVGRGKSIAERRRS